jgi:hypothetical protein
LVFKSQDKVKITTEKEKFIMKGYVMNASPVWAHAMKRSIGPGAKIPLDELYEQYGVKHNIKEGGDFVAWLRNVKLKDVDKWKVVFEDENIKIDSAELPHTVKNKPENVAPMVKTTAEVSDIVELSVRNAREKLPKINDLKLLKFALQEANQLAGKDSLCKLIRKRIQELQIMR